MQWIGSQFQHAQICLVLLKKCSILLKKFKICARDCSEMVGYFSTPNRCFCCSVLTLAEGVANAFLQDHEIDLLNTKLNFDHFWLVWKFWKICALKILCPRGYIPVCHKAIKNWHYDFNNENLLYNLCLVNIFFFMQKNIYVFWKNYLY